MCYGFHSNSMHTRAFLHIKYKVLQHQCCLIYVRSSGRNSIVESSPSQVSTQRPTVNPQSTCQVLEIDEMKLGTDKVPKQRVHVIVTCVKYSVVVGNNIRPIKPARVVCSQEGIILVSM